MKACLVDDYEDAFCYIPCGDDEKVMKVALEINDLWDEQDEREAE